MRVVHVNTEYTWRGGESQVLNLMRGLRRLGHDVELVGMPEGALGSRCRQDLLPVTEMKMRSDADVIAGWRLARHLRRRSCDIVHAQTARAHSIALMARALGGTGRLVVSRRIDFPVRRDPANRLKYRSRLVDRYIAVASIVRDVLVAAGVGSERIRVIHSSIDLARFRDVGDHRAAVREELGLGSGDLVVGQVAALAWHKGQKDLIAALPLLQRDVPSARLVLVGAGPDETALRGQAGGLAPAGAVRFTGAREDVPRLLTAFDAFCMPSYQEGLCNAVLEAFAGRVPVVASTAGGLPEIVRHEKTGLLVPPHDPPALAAALRRLLQDRALAQSVTAAAHRLVHEEFGVERMVERTAAVYEEALAL
ncbi:MAG: glycosyltransferase family 4 protein [Candidatus Polarisedimenticolia bacterium]